LCDRQLAAIALPNELTTKEKAGAGSMDYQADAKQLRRWAAHLRRSAEAITEENTKNSFLELARSYDASAEAEEAEQARRCRQA
jgi:hypothetical protein